MRHRKSFNHLSRKAGHRKAMLANMASSLIKHKRITTTTAKAKALRSYVEPLITKSKDDTTHSRRVVFSYLQDKDAVSELFRDVAAKVADRPGGYTRILKLGNRVGDSAEMAIIELVDYNQNLLGDTGATKTGSRRRRRSGSKKKTETEASTAETQVADVEESQDNVVEDAVVVEETKAETAPQDETTPETEEPVAEAATSEETAAAEETEEVKDEAGKTAEETKEDEKEEAEGKDNEEKKES